MLYRTAQEGLSNVLYHADASRLDVSLHVHPNHVQTCIRDDGVGFDPAQAQSNGHYGLVGIQERVHLVGGHISIESAPGEGTTIEATIPRHRR